METADGSCLIDVEKPRGTVLDVTVKDDDDIHDVMIDSIYDAGTADRFSIVTIFCMSKYIFDWLTLHESYAVGSVAQW